MANFRLGENQKALDDLQVVIGKNPEDRRRAEQYRVIALARLGKKQDALAELAKFQKEDARNSPSSTSPLSWRRNWARGRTRRFETLEAAIRKQPKDADLRYDAARAFSLASKAIVPLGPRRRVVNLRSDALAIAQGGGQERRRRFRQDG